MSPKQDQITGQFTGRWNEIKGELRKTWGEITDDEFERTKGDIQSITGLIQQKYGESKENLKDRIHQIFSAFKESRSHVAHEVKKRIKK